MNFAVKCPDDLAMAPIEEASITKEDGGDVSEILHTDQSISSEPKIKSDSFTLNITLPKSALLMEFRADVTGLVDSVEITVGNTEKVGIIIYIYYKSNLLQIFCCIFN